MTAVAIVVIAAVAVGLVVTRSRINGWARSQRTNGRETVWTKNIGTAAPSVVASRPAMFGTWLGVPTVVALLIAGIVVGGHMGTGLLIIAAALLGGVYALRIRA